MIVKPASDEDIKTVLFDDWIWERETDDSCGTREQVIGFPTDATYLGGYVDGAIIGLAITHPTDLGRQFHFAVLRQYRQLARVFLIEAMREIARPIYCEIPECYREVINFAKHSGFVDEGIAGVIVKHGITYQRTRLWAS